MGYKCAPQVLGLVRGEPKPGARHRGNGKAVCGEGGIERISASETLDRTRSIENTYVGYQSGFAAWDAICDEADEYRSPVKSRDGSMTERGLRHDAVVGFAIIFNPPADMVVGWSREDYMRFYCDSWEVMGIIQPDIFRDENVRMDAYHRDEGRVLDDEHSASDEYDEHLHRYGVPRDRNGRYCGNKIDAKLCIEINENYPRLMRERGWELEDLDVTDWSRMSDDEEYRIERAKKMKGGKSVNQYIRQQQQKELNRARKMTEKALELTANALQMQVENEARRAELDEHEEQLKKYAKKMHTLIRRGREAVAAEQGTTHPDRPMPSTMPRGYE